MFWRTISANPCCLTPFISGASLDLELLVGSRSMSLRICRCSWVLGLSPDWPVLDVFHLFFMKSWWPVNFLRWGFSARRSLTWFSHFYSIFSFVLVKNEIFYLWAFRRRTLGFISWARRSWDNPMCLILSLATTLSTRPKSISRLRNRKNRDLKLLTL